MDSKGSLQSAQNPTKLWTAYMKFTTLASPGWHNPSLALRAHDPSVRCLSQSTIKSSFLIRRKPRSKLLLCNSSAHFRGRENLDAADTDFKCLNFKADNSRVFQIKYAAKAIDNSATVVAIKCKDGVVMGVEKLIASKMMLPGSNRRIHSVHRHSGMAVAGLGANGRQIVARTKSEATRFVPDALLEEAKMAAKIALEEMDAD